MGLGLRPAESAERILTALAEVRRDYRIVRLATVDRRATDIGVLEVAGTLAVPLLTFTAEALSRVEVPHPADRVSAVIGTPSVAEAAAILSGRGPLIVPKRVVDGVVIAAVVVDMSAPHPA
ncbi:cobalamin biosynthesis protein [Nocardia sp. NBC_01377]|uniref:cobalamin biosynthesis protein n=1 Tax=Nocardia sp. NBC_01377 TaxID=2903595 RepID=UPI0038637C97